MGRPTSWITTRPVATARQAAEALERWWGIEGEFEELPSERDRNILVRTAAGTPAFVFKVANLSEHRAFLECQHGAMACLANAGVRVQEVIPSLHGDEIVGLGDPGPPWARVLGWLPGRTLASVSTPGPELWTDLGATMGRSAAALLEFDHPAAHRAFQWDVLRSAFVIARGVGDVDDPTRRATLVATLQRLRRDLEPRLPNLRRSSIHNDANDHNVLVDEPGSRVAGLLDFGDMVHSVTAQELAVAGTYAMFGRPDPWRSCARSLPGSMPHAPSPLTRSTPCPAWSSPDSR